MNSFNNRKRHGQYIKDFNRTIGYFVAKFLYNYSPITANQLTLFRIIIGLYAGVLWTGYFNISYYIIIGGFLLQASSTLDAADGDLAALRGRSKRGAWLDQQTDLSILLFVFLCLSFRYSFTNPVDMIFISKYLFIELNTLKYIIVVMIMYCFSLMLFLKIIFNQRDNIDFFKEKFLKIDKIKSNNNQSKTFINRIKSQIIPSPSFYYPVLFIFSLLDSLLFSVIFLNIYLTATIIYVQVKTYMICAKIDKC